MIFYDLWWNKSFNLLGFWIHLFLRLFGLLWNLALLFFMLQVTWLLFLHLLFFLDYLWQFLKLGLLIWIIVIIFFLIALLLLRLSINNIDLFVIHNNLASILGHLHHLWSTLPLVSFSLILWQLNLHSLIIGFITRIVIWIFTSLLWTLLIFFIDQFFKHLSMLLTLFFQFFSS